MKEENDEKGKTVSDNATMHLSSVRFCSNKHKVVVGKLDSEHFFLFQFLSLNNHSFQSLSCTIKKSK